MTEGDRPQDVGRTHRRRGAPSSETASLLSDWQSTMRDELRAVVEALRARQAGLLPDIPAAFVIPLDDARRDRLVDRGVKVGRELGSAVDADPVPLTPTAAGPKPRRRRAVDYG